MLTAIVVVCTIVGGLAGIWFFRDKIAEFFSRRKKLPVEQKREIL